MAKINIFFLHGFLGRPRDWDRVIKDLGFEESVNTCLVDYFKNPCLDSQNGFQTWALQFNKMVREQMSSQDKNILVAYSLGGRLALHSMQQLPDLWTQTILISTNPGFDDQEVSFGESKNDFVSKSKDRLERWNSDSTWGRKFLSADWSEVLAQWNAQKVFSGSDTEPDRIESDYNRSDLSKALMTWSLARQINMRSVIKEQCAKIHWLVGDRDEKFLDLSQELHQHCSNLDVCIIAGASHRVLFDRPQEISKILRKIISSI